MFFLSQLMKATSSASAVTDTVAVTLPDNDEGACSAPITEAVTPPRFKDMAVQYDIGCESLADVGKISQDHLLLLFFKFFFIMFFFSPGTQVELFYGRCQNTMRHPDYAFNLYP